MNLLLRLEKWLEINIERLFGQQESVQPVEIARRMVRVMEEQRRISVQSVYVPNDFTVHVSPTDLTALESIAQTLTQDIAAHVKAAAKRQSFAFTGPVEVRFEPDAELKKGQYHIEAQFVEGRTAEDEEKDAPNLFPEEAGQTRLYKAEEIQYPLLRITVEEGPDSGAVFTVRLPASIGRRQDCDVRLRDPKVSRMHARLEAHTGEVVVVDMGSTNGTRLNGVPVQRSRVLPGDLVQMGTTRFTVRPAGGE